MKTTKCPQCKNDMVSWKYDIGKGVTVHSLHCTKCQFNITPEKHLASAIATLHERTKKNVRIVAIGDGLGIRFPKELVDEYKIKKGANVKVKPGKNGIEIVL